MGRVRVLILVVAIALLVPGVLLVRRALESVQIEQAARHRAVAERIFDEMERSLSDFLAAEEARPVGHYRHVWSPSGSPRGVLLRSPLADPPDRPFVLGHFEVDRTGQVHTPLRPRASEAPTGWPAPTDSALTAAERVLRLATEAWPNSPAPPAPAQKPGTTVAVGKAAKRDQQLRKEDEKGTLADAYDALKSLNRGAELRSRRSQKVLPFESNTYSKDAEPGAPIEESLLGLREEESERPEPTAELAQRPMEIAGREASSADSEFDDRDDRSSGRAAGPFAKALEAAAAPVPQAARDGQFEQEAKSLASSESPIAPRPMAPARAKKKQESLGDGAMLSSLPNSSAGSAPAAGVVRREDKEAPPRVVIDPMLGFALNAEHVVLHRTVWRGTDAARQGLILEVGPLADALRSAALPAGAFPGSQAVIGTGELEAGSTDEETYSYRHRFAEPFDAMSVNLVLPLLAEASGARTIYILSLLLLFSGTLGLFALYRMVGVVVGFSERRSNFVAAVSHELKTPLTAIRMYAEMLRDDMVPSDEKRNEYYGTITAESERLSRLIDNVLEFSRLERGTREMSWIVGDLGTLVQEAVTVLTPHAQAQGFTLEAEIEPGLPPVRFDRDAVLQILFNLVDNALKYAGDSRQKTLLVRCQADGDRVALLVRDHGPGVATPHLKRIFEPFYRGESELTRRAQGTGIGLSLVKGLAEQMGAALQAVNPEDGGFEIGLVFPKPS